MRGDSFCAATTVMQAPDPCRRHRPSSRRQARGRSGRLMIAPRVAIRPRWAAATPSTSVTRVRSRIRSGCADVKAVAHACSKRRMSPAPSCPAITTRVDNAPLMARIRAIRKCCCVRNSNPYAYAAHTHLRAIRIPSPARFSMVSSQRESTAFQRRNHVISSRHLIRESAFPR